MKKCVLLACLLVLLVPEKSFSWGKTGHRVVGQIAYNHMTKKARKNVQKILGNESLAMASFWMDNIKSDKNYDYQYYWHFATIPDSLTYEQAGTPDEGDVIIMLQALIEQLKTKKFTYEGELHAIRCITHLIGDIHQPLHVGNGKDKGGNDVKLKYMYETSNLHRVWDSGIIDEQQLSFTEYCEAIDFPTEAQIAEWQNSKVLDWAYESKSYRQQIYDLPEDKFLTYKYTFDNIDTLNLRLLQAGIRLAGILNEIYG
ncbi:S1/P1 nuclease [Reichenbachiella sp. MALMAid0571]|uniref:S1/P1 nuclease n=1 Tax=Reichenbachiella sp. MALMAid0571 TaxID=3143939 RepID=UPI0032DEF9F9